MAAEGIIPASPSNEIIRRTCSQISFFTGKNIKKRLLYNEKDYMAAFS